VRPRVYVVQPIPEVALDLMREVADVEVYPYRDRQVTMDELVAAARRSDYIFTMHETMIDRSVIAANPALRGIAVGGADYADMIDVAACREAGVALIDHADELHALTRSLNAKATADLTMALLMCLAYRVVESDAYTRAGRFRQEMTMELMGLGCTGKVAGVIGMGAVARELVPRLRALEMEVVYIKRSRLSPGEESALGVRWVDGLDELLPVSDYVCMLANYNASAHRLMGAREFGLMRPSAYFVNTGRGRLVDEPAMIRALQDGTIAGAGLDVYWNEPPVVHDPDVPEVLRRLPNVVLAPHNGGATWDSRSLQVTHIAQSIVDAIRAGSMVGT
jgi:lactate dehydrogenase-like 2-hydroxyacid dehydrogenase